ncbi:MAG TPA: dTDP-4-dehydrorhamnose reductase [Thermoleophilaceae bacterium]|nr:dTDP-4-dehydrorhamnose reductase [Thermoleophilaceae bacterium]
MSGREGLRIIVTGAGGMLGHEVVDAAVAAGHSGVGLGRASLDVTDPAAVRRLLSDERPDAVINCAGYTNVDGAEEDRAAAFELNGRAPGVVAAAAAEVGAAVLHISSDYVFDGHKGEPYVESDATAPLSAYGESKLAGEEATAAANPRHFVVRSSWLFGLGGRNFVETMLRLASERDEVRVVDDQVGSPTYCLDLADALVRLVATDDYGLHHVAGGGACSWAGFAAEIFRQADVDCRVTAITSAEMDRPAPRPAYSALDSERPETPRLGPWTEGLAAYLASRTERRRVAA